MERFPVRVALCVSGQARLWKRCYQTWFDHLSHFGEIDVFFHFWDYNTLPQSAIGFVTGHQLDQVLLTDAEKKEIVDVLKPKAFEFEPLRIHPKSKMEYPIAWWTRDQFYSLKKAAFIRREYEITHNVDYDVVFRIRSDCVLEHTVNKPSVIEPNTVYTCVNNHDKEFQTFRIGDTFYFANSYTYDQMSKFYDSFEYLDARWPVHTGNKDYPPELAFYYYMKTLGIRNSSNPVHHKIARPQEYLLLKGSLAHYETL